MAKSRSYGYDLEARIAQALRECGLGEKEIKQVAGKIKTYVEFIGPLKADSSFWNFRSKLEKVVEAFSDEDLTYDEYLQAALEQPQLFYQSPDTIESNIRDLVRRFEPEGLTVKAYLKAALEKPQLFCQSPDTIEFNIRDLVRRFEPEGLTVKAYLQAALEQPQLFYRSPDTIEFNIRDLVRRFEPEGLTTKPYLKAALKRPQLFYRSPDTIEFNIRDLVRRFEPEGLTTKPYLKAALKRPQLFCLSPDTIESNIRNLVRRFEPEGLTTKAYLKAALKQPQLFCQSPDTIEQHIHFVQELEKRGVIKIPSKYGSVLEWLLANPKYMAYGSDHYRLKFYYAKLLDKPAALKNLKMPKKKVISELEQAFGSIHRVEKGKTLIDFEKLHSLYIEKYNKSPAEGAYHAYLWNENT
ncbi:MAG: hypothetical protein QW199_00605 [Candidatus Pacearchaeota archaeon]